MSRNQNEDELIEVRSIDDNFFLEKPLSMVILDMVFMIFNEAEIYGQTVRDFLNHEKFHYLNFLFPTTVERAKFEKKIQKLRNYFEMVGFYFDVNNSRDYQSNWDDFTDNFTDHGISNGSAWRVGSKKTESEIVYLLFVRKDQRKHLEPVFSCDQLVMNYDGELYLLGHKSEGLSSSRMISLSQVLDDIKEKRLRLIEPKLKIGYGYEDRFYRSRVMFQSIRAMERGWRPINYDLKDCGLNLNLSQIADPSKSEEQKFQILDYQDYYQWDLDLREESITQDESTDQCPICQREIVTQTSRIDTKCNHWFHAQCLYQNLMKIGANASLCPVCREELVEESVPPLRPDEDSTDSVAPSIDDSNYQTILIASQLYH